MKNILFIIALFLSTNSIFSQINTSEVDVSNFPVIDFTVSDRNPEILDKSSFNFTELIDGDKIKSKNFEVKAIDDTLDYSNKNKCVLILWETLYHEERVEQNKVFYRSLIESLDNVVNDGDMFKIVTFSLNNIDVNILNDLHEDFTDDVGILKEALNSFELENNDFTNKNVSNIYGALNAAIDSLVSFETDLPKSILLLSEEIQNGKPEGQDLRPSVVSQAQKKGIIINTIKYNRFTTHQQHDPGLAKETYGVSEKLSPSDGVPEKSKTNENDHSAEEKEIEAKQFIQSILNNTVKRSSGTTYSVSIRLNNNIKDGNDYFIELKINNTNQILKINYQAPGNWFIAQYQKNKYICISVLEFIFLTILFICYFLWERRKKNKLKRIEQSTRLKEQESEISSQKSELLEIKNKEEERKRIEEEKIRKKEEKELIKQMLAKGGFPVLKFTDKKGSISFDVNKPVMTVGRDKSANICIKNNNISRHHFSIIFENDNYRIIDNNSTNGIILNGKKVGEALLNNTDIIEIADVSFAFFK